MTSFPRHAAAAAALALLLIAAPAPATSANTAGTQPGGAGLVEGELRSLRIVSSDPENVGLVEVRSQAVRRITFENKLAVAVTCSITSKSCGCLTATFDTAAVPPGGRATLTMAANVTPALGQQSHLAIFRVSWREDGEAKSERGMCGLQFQPDVEYVVSPESAGVAAMRGTTAHADVFVRMTFTEDGEPDLSDPQCTLPGWSVARVEDPSLPKGTVRFRAQGPAGDPGVHGGELTIRSGSSVNPPVHIPIRLKVLSPLRAVPGGAVFVRRPGDGPAECRLDLVQRPAVEARAASVELVEPCRWIEATLANADRLDVTLTPTQEMPPAGSTRVRVLDGQGAVLAELPIAWYTAPKDE